jgi:hypothetical protein
LLDFAANFVIHFAGFAANGAVIPMKKTQVAGQNFGLRAFAAALGTDKENGVKLVHCTGILQYL